MSKNYCDVNIKKDICDNDMKNKYDDIEQCDEIDKHCDEIVRLNEQILIELDNIFCPFFNNINIAIRLLKLEQSTTLTYSTALYLNDMIGKTVQYIQCQLINQCYATISLKNVYNIGFNIFIKNLCGQNELLNSFYTIETIGIFSVMTNDDKTILVGYNFTINDYTLVVMENLLKIELQIKSLIQEYKKFIYNLN
jgi:hypothetical protein